MTRSDDARAIAHRIVAEVLAAHGEGPDPDAAGPTPGDEPSEPVGQALDDEPEPAEPAPAEELSPAEATARRIVEEVVAAHAARVAADAEPAEAPVVEPAEVPEDERPDASTSTAPPAENTEDEVSGPPPVSAAVLEAVVDDPGSAARTVSAGIPIPASPTDGLADPFVSEPAPTRELETEDLDATTRMEPLRPRRPGRWLLATILGAIALTVLLPMAVQALRDLVSL